ncbi:Rpn family recombination-promoting nuclease/putative transposase, partial [Streptomyces brasiliscabiei]
PGSFVPAELREYRTDRLYRVRLDSAGPALLVHCVVEHKSTPDPRIGLQLLGYKAQILDWWDRTEGRDTDGRRQPLPPVVSVV